jgi:hypothetical protein
MWIMAYSTCQRTDLDDMTRHIAVHQLMAGSAGNRGRIVFFIAVAIHAAFGSVSASQISISLCGTTGSVAGSAVC